MTKNIVVCCDGTANDFKRDRTNVVKLFQTLDKRDPAIQACYYHPGVGTMAAPAFVTPTGAKIAELAGVAFGYGLSNDICDAYIFICRNYEPGDQLYLFGFSRGAYTARAIASLLYLYGLLPRDNERQVAYTVRMMWAIHRLKKQNNPSAADKQRIEDYFGLAAEFKRTFSRRCDIHFVGVWDTVSSVGWLSSPVSLPYTADNPSIAIGRHAVAIDERRAFFRTNLWTEAHSPKDGPKNMKQVWFPGVHCDVGGGYPESESGLSKIAFKWMLDEAGEAGLVLNKYEVELMLGHHGQRYAPTNPDAILHDSLTSWWKPVEFIPKPHWDRKLEKVKWYPNRSRHRSLGAQPVIHDAAWQRQDGAYALSLQADAVRLSEAKWSPSPISALDPF